MTIQKVNIGHIVNDGLGDDLPTAFRKVNENFNFITENYTVQGINLAGNAGASVFKGTDYSTLQFRNLIPGRKITVEQTSDSVIINSTQEDSFLHIETNNGTITASASPFLKLLGHSGISIEAEGSTIRVKTAAVSQFTTDYGNLTVENNTVNIVGENGVKTHVVDGKIVIRSSAFRQITTENGDTVSSDQTTNLHVEGKRGIEVTINDNKLVIDNTVSQSNRFDFGSIEPITDVTQLTLQMSNIDFNTLLINLDFSKID